MTGIAMRSSAARGLSILRRVLPALVLTWLPAPSARAQDTDPERDSSLGEIGKLYGAEGRAVATVEGLGGKVRRDKTKPGRPVVGIHLARSLVIDADLARLRGLA